MVGSKRFRERSFYRGEIQVKPMKEQIFNDALVRKNINLANLDFDQPVQCLVTHATYGLYCCLQCGRYFKGRESKSPAVKHAIDSTKLSSQSDLRQDEENSINQPHNLYINLTTRTIYWLPQGELVSVTQENLREILCSIRSCILPKFTWEFIQELPFHCHTMVNGDPFITGLIGFAGDGNINNHINVTLTFLAHIPHLRNYFLLFSPATTVGSELIPIISLIFKKMWSPVLLRPLVSSNELLEYLKMKNHFSLLNIEGRNKGNPLSVLLWVIKKLFETGGIRLIDILVYSFRIELTVMNYRSSITEPLHIFVWHLTFLLPETSFFKRERELPHVRLTDLVHEKYAGNEYYDTNSYQLINLPRYLILYFDRYDKGKNAFFDNGVTFPIRNRNQTVIDFPLEMDFPCLVDAGMVRYRLIMNLVNDVEKNPVINRNDDFNHWKIQILNRNEESNWYEIDGVNCTKIDPQLAFLKETYLQVWERQDGDDQP